MENIPDFLIEILKEQYGDNITKQILHGYQVKRKTTLRINTIKTNKEKIENQLMKNNIKFQEVQWYKDSLIIEDVDEMIIKELDMYKNGEIYLQSLSSMIPPVVLDPKPEIDILDMAAAPGGKTTQIAALSNNESHITACEMNMVRMERLKYNLEKQGATCVYAMKKDARTLDDFFSFDKILLDAPCSGSGTLNIKYKNMFTPKLIEKSVSSQIQLLKKAITVLKPGGEMVYSTCSILQKENEDVINKVINNKICEIVPIELNDENIRKLPVKIDGTLCVCPDELYEGFFVAKIKKR